MPVVAVPRAARCTTRRHSAWYTAKVTSLQGLALASLGVVMPWCENAYALLAGGEHEIAYTCTIDSPAWRGRVCMLRWSLLCILLHFS